MIRIPMGLAEMHHTLSMILDHGERGDPVEVPAVSTGKLGGKDFMVSELIANHLHCDRPGPGEIVGCSTTERGPGTRILKG